MNISDHSDKNTANLNLFKPSIGIIMCRTLDIHFRLYVAIT